MFTIAVKFKTTTKKEDIDVILKEYDATVVSIVNEYYHIQLNDEEYADIAAAWIAGEAVVEKALWSNGTRIGKIIL